GQSYPEYLQSHIFEPLGMNDSGYDQHELVLPNRASGYVFSGEEYLNAEFIDMTLPSGAGGLYSTLEDLHKWDRGLYTDVILKESSKKVMFSPTFKDNTLEADYEIYAGYGWFSDVHYQRPRILHNGGVNGFSTHISRYLNERVVIIVLSNLITAPSTAIANDLAAILFGESYEIPKKRQAIDLDPAIYKAYVGKYQLSPDVVLTIKTEDKRIFTQLTGQDFFEIFPESETKFFLKIVDAQLTFIVNETGLASQVILHQNGIEQVAIRM
ncbi:MAG: serine hydrolase, partial [Cyanobacteria bacterium P01_A01_bin.84]